MTINICACLIVLIGAFTGLDSPLDVTQMLWVNLIIDIPSVSDLFDGDDMPLFVTGIFDHSKTKLHLSPYELSVFFAFFVLLQFWNLFNAKYFKTSCGLIQDICGAFKNNEEVKTSFSPSFIYIALVILVGQIIIVTFRREMLSVSPLSKRDWEWILLII